MGYLRKHTHTQQYFATDLVQLRLQLVGRATGPSSCQTYFRSHPVQRYGIWCTDGRVLLSRKGMSCWVQAKSKPLILWGLALQTVLEFSVHPMPGGRERG